MIPEPKLKMFHNAGGEKRWHPGARGYIQTYPKYRNLEV